MAEFKEDVVLRADGETDEAAAAVTKDDFPLVKASGGAITSVQVWMPGSRCRATYSADGLVYPAVLVWVRGQRCLVRFDGYNNEEEHDLSHLLAHNELNGPSRRASTKAGVNGNNRSSSSEAGGGEELNRAEEQQVAGGEAGGGEELNRAEEQQVAGGEAGGGEELNRAEEQQVAGGEAGGGEELDRAEEQQVAGGEAGGGEELDRAEMQQAAGGEAVSSGAAPLKWALGAQCQAMWSEDGRVYPGTVVSVDDQRCRVLFDGYGNQEMDLSALQSPEAAEPQKPDQQVWMPGFRCRATYSADGLVYPAVLVWVRGQRCLVRFDGYNNEEEHDLSHLLAHNELNGPSRRASTKASSTRRPSPTTSSSPTRRRRDQSCGEKMGGEPGQERSEEKVWMPGSRCRATYSADGLVYPAVLVWVRGQRCLVRFDGYNNEEEHDLSHLLAHNELNGPSRRASTKAGVNGKDRSSSSEAGGGEELNRAEMQQVAGGEAGGGEELNRAEEQQVAGGEAGGGEELDRAEEQQVAGGEAGGGEELDRAEEQQVAGGEAVSSGAAPLKVLQPEELGDEKQLGWLNISNLQSVLRNPDQRLQQPRE